MVMCRHVRTELCIYSYIRGVMYLQFPRILTCTCLVWGHVYYAFLKGNLFAIKCINCHPIILLYPGCLVLGQLLLVLI